MLFHLALLSTLSIHLGYKLKQALDTNQQYSIFSAIVCIEYIPASEFSLLQGLDLLIGGDHQVVIHTQTCIHLLKKMMGVSTTFQVRLLMYKQFCYLSPFNALVWIFGVR
ncbi:hypothetical protein ES332_A09G070500v1 [Gossypium tomentosum]|nr:hypothetical protein ES332_A09G070500v1 [Gossypium tomentosum]